MKPIITTIIRCLVYVTAGLGSLLLLDYNFKYCLNMAIGLIFILLVVGLFLNESSKIRKDTLIIGGIYYVMFFGFVLFGSIHVKYVDSNRVNVYSPLWHKLQEGERVDTIELRASVELEYTSYRERFDEHYFLYSKDSVFVYNRLRKVLSIKKDFTIIERPYYGVMVDLLKDENGVVYSLYGAEVDSSWKPYVRDVTPVDPSSI